MLFLCSLQKKLKLREVELLQATCPLGIRGRIEPGHQSVLGAPTLDPDGAELLGNSRSHRCLWPQKMDRTPLLPQRDLKCNRRLSPLPGPLQGQCHFQPFIGALSAPNKYNTLNPELRESCTPGGTPTTPDGHNKLVGGLPKAGPAPWQGR